MLPNDILEFWYSDRLRPRWFDSTPELDAEILQRFDVLWHQAASGGLEAWLDTPEGCLALVIVLDQLPLNMYRGQAKAFQTERQAVQVTMTALEKGFDQQLKPEQLAFLFMPLMHSEYLQEQALSVAMFEKHQLHDNLRFAKHHQGLIQKFGRFPHRNAILGRESTAEEIAYLNSAEAFKG